MSPDDMMMPPEAELDDPLEFPLEEDGGPKYWAADESEKLISQLEQKEHQYFEFVGARGFGSAWLGAYCAYYGIDPDSMQWESHSIGTDGDQGELLRFRINEMRSYVRQSMTMALGQRPAFEAEAINDSYEAMASVEEANTAVNYIYWSKYGERKERRTVEKGDLFGLGWTSIRFDPDAGDEIDVPMELPPEAGGGPSPKTRKARTGELVVKSRAPWEVVGEPWLEDFDDHVWRMERDRGDKFELAARYPELRERILALSCDKEFAIESLFGWDRQLINPDELVVKHFYHDKTRALPQGRYVVFTGNVCLYDGPLPYDSLADVLIDYCPAEFIGTALGYADAWDLIPINQMLDQVVSDVASTVANLGRPTMVAEDGIEVDAESIAAGFRVLSMPPGANPPQFIQPPPLSQGSQVLFELLEQKYASVSGLNQTARGQSTSNVTSGEMAALFHSIAIEVNSGKQMAVDSHRERVANAILKIAKQYMQYPLMLSITGADGKPYRKEVDPSVFQGVGNVIVKSANPMTRTTFGRLQRSQIMMGVPGAVETPEQVDMLLTTGQLKPLYRGAQEKLLRIAWENDTLRKGTQVQQAPDPMEPVRLDGKPNIVLSTPQVPVQMYDPHDMEINEHRAELDCQRMRGNQAGVAALSAHIAEHIRMWKRMDPAVAANLYKIAPPAGPEQMMGQQEPDADDEGSPAPQRKKDSTGIALPKPAQPPKGANVPPTPNQQQ